MKKILLSFIIGITMLSSVYSETISIDIDKAIELLHRNNMDIHSEFFSLKITEREKNRAWNQLLPSLSVSSSSTLMDNPAYTSLGFDETPDPSGPDDKRFEFEVGVNADLNLNLALGAEIKESRLKYEAGEISFEMLMKELEINTKIEFYTLLNMREQMKIMKTGISLAEKRYELAQVNFRNGLTQELDVLSSQITYVSKKSEYSNLLSQYKNLLMGFKLMLGIEWDKDVVLDGSLDFEAYKFNSADLIKKYLAKSLNLKTLNKNLEILENVKKISTGYAFTPILSLGYRLTPLSLNPWAKDYQPSTDSWNFQEKRGVGMGQFTIGLSISLDNFIPGSKKTVELKNLNDQIDQLKIGIKQSALQSEVTILNSVAKIENSLEQLTTNRLYVNLARKAYIMTNEAYQLGTKELLDVESAQNDLQNAEATVLGEQLIYISELLTLEYTLNSSINEITND